MCLGTMCLGTMCLYGGMPADLESADVTGHAPCFEEALNRGGGDTHLYALAYQGRGHAVIRPFRLNVIV